MAQFVTAAGAAQFILNVDLAGQNQPGNYSVVNWALYLNCGNGASWNADPTGWSANIGGATYSGSYTFDFRSSSSKLIASGSTQLGHDGNGNLTFNASGYTNHTGTGAIGGPWGVGGNVTLPRIPKVPQAPGVGSLTQASATSVTLTWSAPDNMGSSITGYRVQTATNSAFTTGVQTVDVGAVGAATIGNQTARATVYARVAARNGVGLGGYSGTKSVSLAVAPTAPTLAPLTQLSLTSLKVDWTAPADNGGAAITGYRIEYATTSDFASPSALTVGNVLTANITGLSPSRTYYVRVAAINSVTTSGTAYVWSGTRTMLMTSDVGDLDGWSTFGTLPAGTTASVGTGLRRGTVYTDTSLPTGLLREIQATGAGSVTAGAIGIQRTMTGLKVGTTYTVDVNAILLDAATPAANVYAIQVVGKTAGTNFTVTSANTQQPLPTYTFVATATSHVLRIVMTESTSFTSGGWFEAVGFSSLKFREVIDPTPYRLQDVALESDLANHFDIACDTVGAAWWVDSENVTQFRQNYSQDVIKATFTDQRADGKREYGGIVSAYDTRNMVNFVKVSNHGRNAVTADTADQDYTLKDQASITAWNNRPADVDMELYTGFVDRTNMVNNTSAYVDLTDVSSANLTSIARQTGATWSAHSTAFRLNGSASASDSWLSVGATAGLRLGVKPGSTYTFSGVYHSDSAMAGTAFAVRARAIVVIVTAPSFNSGAAGVFATSAQAPNAANTTARLSVTFTLPADTTSVEFRMYHGHASTSVCYWTDLMLLAGNGKDDSGTVIPFFDGLIVGTSLYVYSYTGTAAVTPSVRRNYTDIYNRMGEILDEGDAPAKIITRIRWNAQEDPTLAANLEIQDRVTVEFNGQVQDSRIIGMKHEIEAERWMIVMELVPS